MLVLGIEEDNRPCSERFFPILVVAATICAAAASGDHPKPYRRMNVLGLVYAGWDVQVVEHGIAHASRRNQDG